MNYAVQDGMWFLYLILTLLAIIVPPLLLRFIRHEITFWCVVAGFTITSILDMNVQMLFFVGLFTSWPKKWSKRSNGIDELL